MTVKTKWNHACALLCAALLAGLMTTALPACAAATKKYTAIGDSLTVGLYSENVPNGPYPNGFAAQVRDYIVASRGYDAAQYRNLAVAGATSSNVFSGGDPSKGVLENQITPAVADAPDLVTLTVGGNDVKNYALSAGAPTNPADPNDPKVVAFGNAFEAGVRGILSGLRTGVPSSAIFLTNVPKLWLLPAVYDAQVNGFHAFPGATAQDRQTQAQFALSSYVNKANAIIASEATTANAVVINIYGNTTATDSANVSPIDGFHPNRTGHDGLASIFIDALDDVLPVDSSLVVTTTEDGTPNTDRYLSLREAIAFANDEVLQPGAATITFAPDVTGKITLTAALPDINSDITINGPGSAVLAISGNNAVRPFSIQSVKSLEDSAKTLTIQNLAIRNGFFTGEGGAIFNNGNLILSSVELMSNTAVIGGAIYNNYSTPTQLTLNNCALSNNHSMPFSTHPGLGGAIFNGGEFKAVNSTFTENSGSSGAVVSNNAGTSTLTNCTLVDNTATSATGSIISSANVTLNNSIVVGNSGPSGFVTGNGLINGDYNLIGTINGTTFTGTHNKTGLSVAALKIVTLGDNGGVVRTMALLRGSPAFNKGSNALVPSGVTTDARSAGFERVRGSSVDIGAFEIQEVTPPTVTVDAPLAPNVVLSALPANITGTYGDNLGIKGIAAVFGRLYRFNGGIREYWNSGTQAWQITAVKLPLLVRLDGTWRSTPHLPRNNSETGVTNTLPDGTYGLTVAAVDTSGNVGSVALTLRIRAAGQDTSALVLTIDNIQSNATYSQLPSSFTGTVSDNNGMFNVQKVTLRLRRFRSDEGGEVKEHWNPQTRVWQTAVAALSTSPVRPSFESDWASNSALPSGDDLIAGTYCLTAIARDGSNNQGSTWAYFKILPAGASKAHTSAIQLSSVSANSDGTVTLAFTGSVATSAADTARYEVLANGVTRDVRDAVFANGNATVILHVGSVVKGTSLSVRYDLRDTAGRVLSGVAKVVVK